MAQHEKFKFNHTFQAIEFANGICSFHCIFYIVFCSRKLFYAPCDCRPYLPHCQVQRVPRKSEVPMPFTLRFNCCLFRISHWHLLDYARSFLARGVYLRTDGVPFVDTSLMTLGLLSRGPVALAAYYLLFCHDPLTSLVRLLFRFKTVRKSTFRGLIP